jgi:hypothetical protein
MGECYTTLFGLYTFFDNKMKLFNGSDTFMLALLQTQIGNIIVYNNIYTNVLEARSRNRTDLVWFEYGRLAFLMIDVQPMSDSTLLQDALFSKSIL